MEKPLGHKNYGSIGHLPQSRMGPGDHKVTEGQARIATEKTRDKHDTVIVLEKLDGSNVGVARANGEILALGRAGYLAQTSKYVQHQRFADWVRRNEARFRDALKDGQRVVGEWLYQAHGTRYALPHEPFVAFDVMEGQRRLTWDEALVVIAKAWLVPAYCVSDGVPISVEEALKRMGPHGAHGALDPIEGAVWRVERKGEVDFLCKYVRPDKVDGCYLPEMSGKPDVINTWVER